MIGFLVWGRVRIKIRIRVRVTFNVSVLSLEQLSQEQMSYNQISRGQTSFYTVLTKKKKGAGMGTIPFL